MARMATASLQKRLELHDVAVLHDVILAFRSRLPQLAAARETAAGDQIRVGRRLGRNEALFEV